MIGVKVSEEDFGEREAHPVAHHLALGALAALKQKGLAFTMNGKTRDIALDGRARRGRTEESDG
ncbi:MAG TPA: hypothetical protein VN513_12700 [Gemmatimonadales bacterium]|nr:hypothetical protein [Gemmatimonadales bacterium]